MRLWMGWTNALKPLRILPHMASQLRFRNNMALDQRASRQQPPKVGLVELHQHSADKVEDPLDGKPDIPPVVLEEQDGLHERTRWKYPSEVRLYRPKDEVGDRLEQVLDEVPNLSQTSFSLSLLSLR